MECKRCGSDRILKICAKHSDLINYDYKNVGIVDGITLRIDGIFEGDYINTSLCLECGQIQADFPIADDQLPEQLQPEEG